MNYAYARIEEECVGMMGDRELDDLMKDVAKLVHDREWNLSGDTCDETYAQSVREFKQKWFDTVRRDRLITYINEACDQARAACLAMIGVEDVPLTTAQMQDKREELVEKYGEFVDKTEAGRIIGMTRATVYAMISDGRLKTGHRGKRVSVRSIADYLFSDGRRRA